MKPLKTHLYRLAFLQLITSRVLCFLRSFCFNPRCLTVSNHYFSIFILFWKLLQIQSVFVLFKSTDEKDIRAEKRHPPTLSQSHNSTITGSFYFIPAPWLSSLPSGAFTTLICRIDMSQTEFIIMAKVKVISEAVFMGLHYIVQWLYGVKCVSVSLSSLFHSCTTSHMNPCWFHVVFKKVDLRSVSVNIDNSSSEQKNRHHWFFTYSTIICWELVRLHLEPSKYITDTTVA